jgi:hypothetical protein
MPKDFPAGDLAGLLPPLNRAREYRLYGGNGKRFTDLWLYGGRAILGHRPPGVLRELKNAGERGLFVPLPQLREDRLAKALAFFFPGRRILLFREEASLRKALGGAGVPGAGEPFFDPALDRGPWPELSLWRPFLPAPEGEAGEGPSPRFFVPVLPWPLAPWALAVSGELPPGLPPGDRLSPPILAAAARSVQDLALAEDRGKTRFPRIEKALRQSPWRRRGIYLHLEPPPGPEAYGEFFRRFLDGGFLLPPNPGEPLILPGILSPGEEAKLARLLEGGATFQTFFP